MARIIPTGIGAAFDSEQLLATASKQRPFERQKSAQSQQALIAADGMQALLLKTELF
jgi:hypothetical protein